ncbi:hypothetical protein GCM10010215_39950 [Streptomyces virginiae]|uniref:CBS domain-containing protein n=1 Tax=Streptomyces virginiae TaxID=1961 RepID=A0ABQ3NZJ4_STRVG|nr:hypothetical protein [Streptomyces virginiae]MBP2343798.1 hypothetical protein [Streptomyces virginiae]GGQ10921.1 hypothetical protein GCM10010215_39950 [Streptomyces virginiae]GHI18190.1 hypothetical protein Scinn_76530 [Streptomyces virginiae]
MGRNKPNKPRRERSMFGSAEMDLAMSKAVNMALESNNITAVTRDEGRLKGLMTVRDFSSFDDFVTALEWVKDIPHTMFVVLPDVIELECRLAELPNIDRGTPMHDVRTGRTARVYRYADPGE